jgi:hypothetical protein
MPLPLLVLPAHHAALLAIPAFGPAIVVVAVILFIAWRDRRDERRENESANGTGEEKT